MNLRDVFFLCVRKYSYIRFQLTANNDKLAWKLFVACDKLLMGRSFESTHSLRLARTITKWKSTPTFHMMGFPSTVSSYAIHSSTISTAILSHIETPLRCRIGKRTFTFTISHYNRHAAVCRRGFIRRRLKAEGSHSPSVSNVVVSVRVGRFEAHFIQNNIIISSPPQT